jgi:hypothetical protein
MRRNGWVLGSPLFNSDTRNFKESEDIARTRKNVRLTSCYRPLLHLVKSLNTNINNNKKEMLRSPKRQTPNTHQGSLSLLASNNKKKMFQILVGTIYNESASL